MGASLARGKALLRGTIRPSLEVHQWTHHPLCWTKLCWRMQKWTGARGCCRSNLLRYCRCNPSMGCGFCQSKQWYLRPSSPCKARRRRLLLATCRQLLHTCGNNVLDFRKKSRCATYLTDFSCLRRMTPVVACCWGGYTVKPDGMKFIVFHSLWRLFLCYEHFCLL
jgi:hypothetical protein